jgi:ATP-dependent exoDNAse (exonuclease V) beta subunit
MTEAPDATVRARALDPERSFIVQAPAGSGKTELLIQRCLGLLARVDAPEEIVAITFTRKAAAEMRERVLRALAEAATGAEPAAAHARTTWRLARAVLARDAELGWRLRDCPQRLRIQTIDAFCAGIGRQLPYLSGLGGPPQLADDAAPLHREAARAALATLEQGDELADAVARTVAHRDADLDGLERLLAAMLAKRDQWLRHLHADDSAAARRERLEQSVRLEVAARLAALQAAFPEGLLDEACGLAADAAAELVAAGGDAGSLAPLADGAPPGSDEAALPRWRALAALLLTNDGNWRKLVAAAQGFPPPSKATGAEKARRQAHKQRALDLLAALRAQPTLDARLHEAAQLPAARYAEPQWAVLGAIAQLLVLAAAHLKLVFARHGRVDFLEVAQRAHAALVDGGAPTDLALALDYRIGHLLVDEFQDTSRLQYQLLERLTEGWTPGDGRTLFLVGDPMQSIYRFREAEVGLFLDAWAGGLGGVPLEPLRLAANFRSGAALVDWFNAVFPTVLPPQPEALAGAVPYAPAAAMRPADAGPAVTVHPRLARDAAAEAEAVVGIVRQARSERPGGTLAVLVRGRKHLHALLPRLRVAGLRFRAVDIEPLAAQPAVAALRALVGALLHRGDRVAWLALLRGPGCGLELADLLALAGDDLERPIPALLADPACRARLTVAGRARVERLVAVLEPAQAALGRGDLRRLVEGAWLALGGPAWGGGEAALQAAEAFLDLLDDHAAGGTLPDPEAFDEALASLYAPPDPEADESLQLMTVHKAKGLEFDTVIVPGLDLGTGSDRNPLLAWLELPQHAGGLLMAPIDARGAERDPLYAWIRRLEREREGHESGRLLYVAATRARDRLHLLGAAGGLDKEGVGPKAPRANTFLHLLWEALAGEFQARVDAPDAELGEGSEAAEPARPPLTRLPLDWRRPEFPATVPETAPAPDPVPGEAVIFDWAGEGARAAGSVVHRLLEAWGRDGLPAPGELPPGVADYARTALREQGLSGTPLADAAQRVERALAATVADPRGRWLFDPAHSEARSELALTAQLDGQLVALVVDRTFVAADGTRWIVDFKTSDHRGGGLEAFLDREQARYRDQLERYARALAALDPRPQRLALYFPLVGGWREWEVEG